MPALSVIATTYNQPQDLDLYLRSLVNQSFQDFEVLIADDGSSATTRQVIDSYSETRLKNKIKHIWHEDKGYRKSKILNEAIRHVKTDWIVFTDTDLLLHADFLADHYSYKSPKRLFMGRRVNLGQSISEQIRNQPDLFYSNTFLWKLFLSTFDEQIPTINANRGLRISNALIRQLFSYNHVPDLLGSNFSICKDLLFAVNGFDESLEHYWGEDGDLFIRCRNSNANIVGCKTLAVQFHLWHKQRAPLPEAEQQYQKRFREDFSSIKCDKGIL